MRPRTKPVALTLAAIAALLLFAAAIVWIGARTGAARRAAADYLGEMTGLPVSIAGLSVALLPTPALQLEGLAIAQPPGFDGDPLVDIGKLCVSISWGSLFGGDLALRLLAISEANVRPTLIADGSDNWSALIDRLSSLGGKGASHWSIGEFHIDDGAFEFYDAASNLSFRLTAITIEAGPITPAVEFPIELQLAGVSADNTLHFAAQGQARIDPDAGDYGARDLAIRGWVGGDPLPLAGIELEGGIGVASFESKTGVAEIKQGILTVAGIRTEFALRSEVGDRGAAVTFSLSALPFSPRAAAIALGHPLPATADAGVFQALEFTAKGRLDQGLLELDPVEGRLDNTRWNGAIVPQFRNVRLSADWIDIDQYLAPESKMRSEKKATLEETIAELGKLDIDAEIRIAEARVAGAKLRDVLLKVERGHGTNP